jgi:hypothetical protein
VLVVVPGKNPRQNSRACSIESDRSGNSGSCKGARPRPDGVSAYVDQHQARFGWSPSAGSWACRRPRITSAATGERSARRVEDERLLALIR